MKPMSDLLSLLSEHALRCPGQPALICGTEQITYGELEDYSSRLALYLDGKCRHTKNPIVVYGHKHPFMAVCFLACAKAGRPFCPVDTSIPAPQLQMILDNTAPPVIFAVEALPASCQCHFVLPLEQIRLLLKETRISSREVSLLTSALKPSRQEDLFYILFQAEENGIPRGVEITADCLDRSLDPFVYTQQETCTEQEVLPGSRSAVVLNQTPFSFPLSAANFYAALARCDTLWCLDRKTQTDPELLASSLRCSRASVFVGTPSFAEACLDLADFCQETLPDLKHFHFCGELLENKTVQKLYARFPAARIYNTYGHGETTSAVTQICITPELARTAGPLPCGSPRSGTFAEIWDSSGNPVEEGRKGEIVILGDTVSPGYYKNSFLTKESFFTCIRDGRELHGYRTGDLGYLLDGVLFCCGRIDLQVKLHGYQVELEDIERNLLRLPQISRAAVLPKVRNHKVSNLYAWVVCPDKHISDKTYTSRLKEDLLSFLPEHLIPKKFIFVKQLPVNGSGRLDRQALEHMVS